MVRGSRLFFEAILTEGGSLKRQSLGDALWRLGMASFAFIIPKTFGFEAATSHVVNKRLAFTWHLFKDSQLHAGDFSPWIALHYDDWAIFCYAKIQR